MLFSFPEDARWNADMQVVEFERRCWRIRRGGASAAMFSDALSTAR
jgi:hypothetical protein